MSTITLASEQVESLVSVLADRIVDRVISEVRDRLAAERVKDWYSTEELAAALGKARWTIQEKWCNAGRIECQKDHATGKWRIPGHEFTRLVNGGLPHPKKR